METTKHKVGRVLLTITLIIAFLGCMLMAITLPFLSTVGVASADSSAGVVKDNLFSNPTFDLTGDGVFSFQNYFKQDIVYTNGASLSLNNNVLVASTTTSGSGHWVAFLFKPTETGTYTFTINADFVGSSGYLWRLRDTDYRTYVDSSSNNFSNYQFVTYNITDLSKNYILQMVMPTANVSTNIYWVKFEKSSSFTGYVPKDYSNYGYNQGVEYGLDHSVDTLGYYRLDNLSWNSYSYPYFTFNGVSYLPGAYTEDTYSNYNYNNPNFAIVDSLDGETNKRIGFKYSNDSLYGDIMVTMPYVLYSTSRYITNLQVVFEDTVTGEIIFINADDTVHWNVISTLGNINNQSNFTVYLVSIKYYCKNPVNLYFIPFGTNITYAEDPIYFPLNAYDFNVYCTGADPLNDSVASYDLGFSDGQESVDTGSYYDYGYRQGYAKGHTDGVAEHTDYSFLGLISAVVDAPIKAFSGLLEFKILGVNLKNFVLGLLTLAVIIIIIKIALGGK